MKKILFLIALLLIATACVSTKSTLRNVDENAPTPQLKDNTFVITEFSKDKKYGFDKNYPINIFIDTKKQEIFDIFSNGSNTNINMADLKSLFVTLSPKDIDSKWNKWK